MEDLTWGRYHFIFQYSKYRPEKYMVRPFRDKIGVSTTETKVDMRNRSVRKAPAVLDAEAFISNRIAEGVFKPGCTLPTLARMAELAGVSYVSMWKAVSSLREKGVLETRPGQPIKVSAPSTNPRGREFSEYVPSNRSKWEMVMRAIERDIYSGVYAPDTLMPSVKELESAYGVSYSVVRKALSALVNEKVIAPRARGFAPTIFFRQKGRNRIILFAPCTPNAQYVIGMFHEELIHCLEKECMRSDAAFLMVGYHLEEDGVHYYNFLTGEQCTLTEAEDSFGYVVFVSSGECGWEEVLQRLVGVRKPVALIDQVGGLTKAREIMRYNPQFQIFSIGTSSLSGRDVGRYLLSLGHRRIAYLSPYHKSDWSIQRCHGIVSAFESAGHAGGVRLFTSTLANSIEVIAHGVPESKIEVILDAYQKLRTTIHPSFRISLDRVFHLEDGLIQLSVHDAQLRRYFEPMFDATLEDPSITAWVAANDHLSVLALEYLRKKRIRCPGDISLIGFDDARWALENRLTTYNFNVPGLVHNVVRHILDERFRKLHARLRFVEVDGMVIERGRCGKVAPSP